MKGVDLKFSDGLIPVIVQDVENEEVLMMAYMNEEALKRTLDTGKAHYWSRSRGKLWLKGEESGNFQSVREVRVDCDGDTILLKVKQIGGACHKGYRSCFYRRINGDIVSEKVFEPSKVYKEED
ncbi:MAG: phosphoribosyl-AMP cyclohydrolase [Candidatus Methanolliviera hydrocarbonicum]|jgi:phosphoribosyl-AMP cyclohydrolase (EC 3.5.4.19)|uniref:Phosphoribosyl-AMP cyclohydrolase n=1 Tax=Candidatus Methanolliviera hydrocarbonicum TaxID=2491085 RepID=A0A520KWS8_9EURY|nr:MAG: phosphoribosyl-AMP cyclohydrolase [Candidatus Methanolliviera hydrocarbonicum]